MIIVDDSKWYDNFAKRGEEFNLRLMNLLSEPLRWKPINDGYYRSGSVDFINAALFTLKVEKNVIKAKQYLYYSELCQVRRYLEFASGAEAQLGGLLPSFFRTPLSGSTHLYPFFAQMTRPKIMDKKVSFLIQMVRLRSNLQQAAMVKDLDRLDVELTAFEEVCAKLPKKVEEPALIAFYRALLEQNADKVEEALMMLLEPKLFKKMQKEYYQSIPGRFMAWITMWCAKLAWINGYEIEIDHPFILSELLPDTDKPKTSIEDGRYPFLIDPVLEDYDFWHYGGSRSDEEVEQHNQAIYQTRIPARYAGVDNFVKLDPDPEN